MAFAEDRKKATNLVLNVMSRLDRSGKNVALYKEKFSNMTDKEFIKFCKTGIVRLFIEAFDNEPSFDDIMDLCDSLGCPLMEEVTIPSLYTNTEDPDDELICDKKVMVGPVTFKVLQQMATKEGASTSDIKKRDKFNQVTGEDKAAMISDQDVACLVGHGLKAVPTELLTFRADNEGGKEDAYSQLMTTGKCNIPDSIKDPKNKRSLQILDIHYMMAHIDTNLTHDLEE